MVPKYSRTFLPIKGVTRKDVMQFVPIIKPYVAALHPFSSASRGKNGGKRHTANDEVSVAAKITVKVCK